MVRARRVGTYGPQSFRSIIRVRQKTIGPVFKGFHCKIVFRNSTPPFLHQEFTLVSLVHPKKSPAIGDVRLLATLWSQTIPGQAQKSRGPFRELKTMAQNQNENRGGSSGRGGPGGQGGQGNPDDKSSNRSSGGNNPSGNLSRDERVKGGEKSTESQERDEFGQFAESAERTSGGSSGGTGGYAGSDREGSGSGRGGTGGGSKGSNR